MPTVTATPVLRDRLITEFRSFLCEQVGFVPFVHQAAWWASTDGQELLDTTVADTEPGVVVRLPDGTTARRGLQPRPEGRAKVVAELGAYKSGKSAGAGIWAASFAAVPNATVYLVGNEYDMCVPEFDYLLEALCSERGLNQPAKSIQNRPKDGRLWLELENGARFEARSWERSESLKGKEVDAYIYCEAYQLPGIECFTSVAQNLRVRKGYAVFPTTPDRPWVEIFHSLGHHHPDYADWACHCGIPATVNPYSFDQDAMDRDRGLLTREKFAIAYLGTLGEYVGRVFNYQRGTRLLDMADHPHWWHHPDGSPTRDNFRLPSDWHVEIGADTGTYCAATAVAVTPEGRIVVLDEVTNYAYVANTPELDPESSIVRWTREVKAMAARWKVRPVAWVDSNSQFKRECIHHGLYLQANKSGKEARTEAARQYFQHDQIQVAPWLTILPYELEQARWPDRISAAGKYERLKQNDHAVDCLEHVLSRHPRGQAPQDNQVVRLPGLIQWMGHPLKKKRRSATDQHLGAQ